MTTTATPLVRPGAVVVGHDGSTAADRALRWAAADASAEHRLLAIALVLAHGTSASAAEAAGKNALRRAADEVAGTHPDLAVSTVLVCGEPARELAVLGVDARTIVVGSPDHGWRKKLPARHVGARLSQVAPCPVVVVPDHHEGMVRRGVLVGVSVHRDAEDVLAHAFHHASLHDLPLTVVHAATDLSGASTGDRTRWVVEAVSGFREDFPDVHVDVRVTSGRAVPTLLELAEPMHLLVVGQHTYEPDDLTLIGHVGAGIVDRSPCPIAIVPLRERS